MRLLQNSEKGFTLIELLVVISIIALLLSILMPSLSKVKESARAVVCRSNLKQWGVIWSLYCNDNNDRFHTGYQLMLGDDASGRRSSWPELLRDYYADDGDFRCCPAAIDPDKPRGSIGTWGPFGSDDHWRTKGDYGSYGVNRYIHNLTSRDWTGPISLSRFWRTPYVGGASNIPLMLDSDDVSGWPTEFDAPPEIEDFRDTPIHHMRRFCINRHSAHVNSLFLDMGVREVGLKELWTLKWHSEYDTRGPWTLGGRSTRAMWEQFAPWMANMKDY